MTTYHKIDNDADFLRGACHALTWMTAPAHMDLKQTLQCTQMLRAKAEHGAPVPPFMYWLTLCAQHDGNPWKAYEAWERYHAEGQNEDQ